MSTLELEAGLKKAIETMIAHVGCGSRSCCFPYGWVLPVAGELQEEPCRCLVDPEHPETVDAAVALIDAARDGLGSAWTLLLRSEFARFKALVGCNDAPCRFRPVRKGMGMHCNTGCRCFSHAATSKPFVLGAIAGVYKATAAYLGEEP